ncbi:MAG: isochorismate synthase [Moorea sp. SIO2B7]|nr:isochorismate synthase [Moorena sp. SIO2B7]
MSAPMPVIPCHANLFQDERQLYRFLLTCQEKSSKKGNFQIVSFSQEIDFIDPLAFLQANDYPDQLHFYWENCRQEEAIAAIDSIKSINITSSDRFVKSQRFMQNCLKNILRIGDTHLSGTKPCFFSSFTFFDSSTHSDCPFPPATVFLPKFQLTKRDKRCFFVANFTVNSQVNIELTFKKITQQIKTLSLLRGNLIECTSGNREKLSQTETNKTSQFKKSVASALKSIQDQHFSKIVIAHTFDIISPVTFHLVESLNNLRQRHPDCYIFSLSNGKGHNFIGASPERLISIQNNQLATDALAGSAPRGKTTSEDVKLANQLLKSEKERREHQAVSNFITQRLCELGLNPVRSPLQLLQLSNIQHLWTPIYAQIPFNVHPLDIVAQLHPTPAVAGVPTEIACEQIRHYETFDRSLYAAPLGWVDSQGNGEFIVGIRSALITGNHAQLYGGAGIVAGSDPDKEFAEVQLKLQSLLKALV